MRCDDLIAVLFPHFGAVLVERVFLECGTVRVSARTRSRGVPCPDCSVRSSRVHSAYERRLADTPVGGQPVLVELTVRRLYCENTDCWRCTFVEQVEGLTVRYGRRTPGSRRIPEAVAVALAGRAGSRFAGVLGSVVSRTTLLRLVMALPDPHWPVPRVLGVDDFATHRGQHYGTVIIDCATGQPLDLLPGRDAKTLASWLGKHPGWRSSAVIEAAPTPMAPAPAHHKQCRSQTAFTSGKNLGTAVETSVRRHNAALKPSTGPDRTANISTAGPASTDRRMSPIEARIRERHTIVHALLAQGHGIREIARELHIGGNTVRRTARAESPEQLLAGRRQPRPSQLDPYKTHLDKRWSEGCTNAIDLHAELQELGYRGHYQTISDYLRPRRRQRIRVVGPAPPGVRQITGLMMRHPDRLRDQTANGSLKSSLAAPNSMPRADSSVGSPRFSPPAQASTSKTGSPPSAPKTCPACPVLPPAWRRTGTPSSRA